MKPLAERMRPKTPDEFFGQEHILGPNATLRRLIENDAITSMILWGPPGSGKTTLAQMIANLTGRKMYKVNAIESGVKQIKEIANEVSSSVFITKPPILFIDEIHRFSKSQQDSLLKMVEEGKVILVAATTENPSFEVINPLLSRCQVYRLNALDKEALLKILQRALAKDEVLKKLNIKLKESEALIFISGGDARKLLNALEITVNFLKNEKEIIIDNEIVRQIHKDKIAYYDKNSDLHYDIISAFIKSVRGSDPDAAIYWLARMLNAGEDIKFIARRLIILAAEDIGLANPNALLLANACFDAVSKIGMPEARIILSETTIYLATSPKSNSAYKAINKAMDYVKKHNDAPVPLHLRNAPTSLMKELGYSDGYKYPHDFPNNYVYQQYLPDSVKEKFYIPGHNAQEEKATEKLKRIKGEKRKG